MKEFKKIKTEIINEVLDKYSHDDLGHKKFITPNEGKRAKKEIKARMKSIKTIDVNFIKRGGKTILRDGDLEVISYKNATYEFMEKDESLFVIPDFSDYVYCYEIKPMAVLIRRFKNENPSNDIKQEENENK